MYPSWEEQLCSALLALLPRRIFFDLIVSGEIPVRSFMENHYAQIQNLARRIVAGYPLPEFYKDYASAVIYSKKILETNPLLVKIRSFVSKNLDNDFGHGLDHAIKVTLDAGALIFIESKIAGYSDSFYNRRVIIAQSAGLMHDIKRKEKDHSEAGATFAREALKDCSFLPEELDDICTAIKNHEAFKNTVETKTPEGKLISDCLYDADKFRWGPDNFTDTFWEMISYINPPFSEFIALYPKGMESLHKIKLTFRSETGKKYGPGFIDIGIAIGEELFEIIKKDFAYLL
ncbi:MAG: HD domain-containing protein [Desulfobacterium sp.]|nr:HD domain-containing protein [Desulfobacterium sp.]MBU4010893.1 HD domain-containing protein [Pseudomonadota bacterium]